jgi:VanZ family protein
MISAWLPVLIWMFVIFLFSGQPHSAAVTGVVFGQFNLPVRKLAHASEYAILFLLSRRAFRASEGKSTRLKSLKAIVLCLFYALSDEWHQSFVPGRSASLNDVAIDISGAFLASVTIELHGLFTRVIKNNGS